MRRCVGSRADVEKFPNLGIYVIVLSNTYTSYPTLDEVSGTGASIHYTGQGQIEYTGLGLRIDAFCG